MVKVPEVRALLLADGQWHSIAQKRSTDGNGFEIDVYDFEVDDYGFIHSEGSLRQVGESSMGFAFTSENGDHICGPITGIKAVRQRAEWI